MGTHPIFESDFDCLTEKMIRRAFGVRYLQTMASKAQVRNLKIYTKTGDKGVTSLYTGERRTKTDNVFEALGVTDELSSVLGIAKEYSKDQNQENVSGIIRMIQGDLQEIGSAIATPLSSASERKLNKVKFPQERVDVLEKLIDELDAALPPLTTFILPGGGKCSAHLHLARSICRRAERRTIPLIEAGETDSTVGRYLNRLSDLLFQLARSSQMASGLSDQ